ncbi:MAG: TIGR03986 family CRISPR-associated RAMP protein [Gemmatimonadota bacterium]
MALDRHARMSDTQNKAIAPYNFVPLPDSVMPHPEVESDPDGHLLRRLHDRFHSDRYTGSITLTIKTETPLYTRCATSSGGGPELETDFFHHGEDPTTPFIPGSSLRGMIRSLVEIISYSGFTGVDDRQLYYRTFGFPESARERYTERMEAVKGGFLRVNRSAATVEPREVLRVSLPMLNDADWTRPRHYDAYPPVWFKRAEGDPGPGFPLVSAISLKQPVNAEEWEDGCLVCTGPMQGKEHEFVFSVEGIGTDLPVPESVLEEVNQPDQITQWQEGAFPESRLRARPGEFADGDAVFYLVEGGKVDALGRARMFRLPYKNRTRQALPQDLRAGHEIDLAGAIFGMLHSGFGSRPKPIKGRVSFEDARCMDPSPFLDGDPRKRRVPKILSSPKPSSFQLYLVQTGNDQNELRDYDDPNALIRGHKAYWHKEGQEHDAFEQMGDGPGQFDVQAGSAFQNKEGRWTKSKLHTVIRPVRAGVSFTGRVRFENLSSVELGALLTALDLGETKRHRLGMGKPLGLGSVRLECVPVIEAVASRYSDPFRGVRHDEKVENIVGQARRDFRDRVFSHDGESVDSEKQVWALPRLQALAKLLEWKHKPASNLTDYAEGPSRGRRTDEQWKHRWVLPSPHDVEAPPNSLPGRRAGGGGSEESIPAPTESVRKAGDRIKATVIELVNNYGAVKIKLDSGELLDYSRVGLKVGDEISVTIKQVVNGKVKQVK